MQTRSPVKQLQLEWFEARMVSMTFCRLRRFKERWLDDATGTANDIEGEQKNHPK